GPVIAPGKPAESPLLARIIATDNTRMPPEGERLSPDETAVIRRWIEQGARSPADERVPKDPAQHWSVRIPKRPPVPQVAAAGESPPIDAFLAGALSRRGLQPVGPAPRFVLLRRVTFDLTGLPPTPEELRDFLADTSPQGYARVVDRLLASPAYGERWG